MQQTIVMETQDIMSTLVQVQYKPLFSNTNYNSSVVPTGFLHRLLCICIV